MTAFKEDEFLAHFIKKGEMATVDGFALQAIIRERNELRREVKILENKNKELLSDKQFLKMQLAIRDAMLKVQKENTTYKVDLIA